MCFICKYSIVGVERILEYTDLQTEAEWYIDETAPQSGWPFNGNIKLNEYSTKYRTGLDLVLKQISFDIRPGEKVIQMFHFFETIIYMFSDVFIDRNSRQNRCR